MISDKSDRVVGLPLSAAPSVRLDGKSVFPFSCHGPTHAAWALPSWACPSLCPVCLVGLRVWTCPQGSVFGVAVVRLAAWACFQMTCVLSGAWGLQPVPGPLLVRVHS